MQFAYLYPFLYQTLRPIFPDCLWSGSEQLKTIALTFDDGPHPDYTPELLKILDRYSIQVSFFCLGSCVNRHPEVVKAIYERGHWLGLHGYFHRCFPLLSEQELQTSLQKTQTAIFQACQLSPEKIRDVRPPNGVFTPKTLKLLRQWSYRPVMWSVVPEDWTLPGTEIVQKRVNKQVTNGSVIVLHDGYDGGKAVATICADLIPRLLEQGYSFVTVDQFWQQL
jgi:peptidoglycan/xylan/chitin deacetylase (PgdA/CDA1 family)